MPNAFPSMPAPRFLQVHTLTSYPGVLLNRDDAGLAKRLPYGGTVRTRVSSQCLKRHWRIARGNEWGLDQTGAPLSTRSREVFEYAIRPRLVEQLPAADAAAIDTAGLALSKALYGEKAEQVRSRQALLLGWREIEYLTRLIADVVRGADSADEAGKAVTALFKNKDARANLSAMKDAAGDLASGLEAALFGRMVTSDPAANTDAAIHVAHAFTVHHQESETDYFTVVDDLRTQDDAQDAGSAGIFDTELTSGLFYGYIVVDVPLLVANITGKNVERWADTEVDRGLPAKVVEHLLHLVATVSPGAKKGSTAPYAWTQCMLVEVGARQPRTLASAFEQAVRATPQRSLSQAGEEALFDRLAAFDRAYGAREARCFLSLAPEERPGARGPLALDELARWAAETVAHADAALRS
ncbi:type I-E CRISPR-associated protein Cas7/Cse4/CasC [Gemmatimonadetes bacterium T265]|nr:type I-E CRISPR-associated protein Cas7/Cse4/CasC [Gemmatimonadetes bacterium T265]